MQAAPEFQVAQRRGVQRQEIAALIKAKAREMRHVAAQMLRQIMQDAARRADGRVRSLQPEAIERGDFEMSRTVNSAVSGAKTQSS